MEMRGGCGNFRLVLVVLLAAIVNGAAGVKFAGDGTRSQLHKLSKVARAAREYEKGDEEQREFFEVTKPVDIPKGATETCSQTLLQHTFGNTINDPPTFRDYTPRCARRDYTLILLRWHATCKGRQFDRISAVWLSGVEIFRTCTAEPTPSGIVWTAEKDVTRFQALLTSPQRLAVSLANVIDATYTGVYNVTLSAHFFTGGNPTVPGARSSYGGVADAILPLANPAGYWLTLQNESDAQTLELAIPPTAYKATLELCVSFHGPDEFWYTNPPNDFLEANNLTASIAGNGTFREVLLAIDGRLAAAVFPFPVFYTGGVDPFFWRPISAIGSFVLPSYDVDITAFLPSLVDSKPHQFAFTVTNALPYWLLTANLHLWLDATPTSGALTHHSAPPLAASTTSTFRGMDGTFTSSSSRELSYSGYLLSSLGNLTTSASVALRFSNTLVYSNGASTSHVHQEIKSESKLVVKSDARDLVFHHRSLRFPLKVRYQERDENKTAFVSTALEHAWEADEQLQSSVGAGFNSFSALRNRQRAKGDLVIPDKGAISGFATTKQRYASESSDGCYVRSVGARNYTFLYDETDRRCTSVSSY